MAIAADGAQLGVTERARGEKIADRDAVAVASRKAGAAAADRALQAMVRFWFIVTFVGQLVFVVHIVSFYGRTALRGDFAAWNKHLAVGYVPGDALGNSSLGVHLMMAAVLTFCGLLQLIPQIRERAPVLHRWTGRIYIPSAVLGSLTALYLVLVRGGTVGDVAQHSGVVLNGLLIIVFAALALRYARARDFRSHRRWALRLFLVVSGVWFFRVGLFFWILINRGPVGFNPDTFAGPALTILSFAQFLLPLAVLETYLHTRERGGAVAKYVLAAALGVLTLAVGVGIFGHTMLLVRSGTAI